MRRHGNYFKAGIAVLRRDPKRLGALQQPLRVAGKDRNGTDARVALIAPNKWTGQRIDANDTDIASFISIPPGIDRKKFLC